MATKKQSTMKTAGVKNASVITDGCNPELAKVQTLREKVTHSSFAICDYYRHRIRMPVK